MMTSHKPSRNVVHGFFGGVYVIYEIGTNFPVTPKCEKWHISVFFKTKLNLIPALPQQGWSFWETSTPLDYWWHHGIYLRPKQLIFRAQLLPSLLFFLIPGSPLVLVPLCTECWHSGWVPEMPPECSSPLMSCLAWGFQVTPKSLSFPPLQSFMKPSPPWSPPACGVAQWSLG